VSCDGAGAACALVSSAVRDASGGAPATGDPIRVLVGPWSWVRSDPVAAQIERGPQVSGVFAEFQARDGGYSLRGLDEDGRPSRTFGANAGLVAATRRYEAPPVWVVTGTSAAGAGAAAGLLDTAGLRDRYAVAVEEGEETPLPSQ